MKKALFLSGGWDGHHPEKIVQLFAEDLRARGLEPEIVTTLEPLADVEKLKTYALVFPCWTMGTLTNEQEQGLVAAVRAGLGLAGIHGGMGDAFRGRLDYEWMVGGHFVGHPHVGDYEVRVTDHTDPITAGLPEVFAFRSEQYYLLVDPVVHVLAETDYRHEGRVVRMPVAWTKSWGAGRVFYNALGHQPEEFVQFPDARRLTVQGCLWAAGLL
ncbi:MAG: ThuA domain-containing protein [Burkholderiales bacterium]|nr:ThuA domain-containing protein [Opitutaceae bacterium]